VLDVVGAAVVAGEVDVELLAGGAVVGGVVTAAAVVDVAGAAGAAGGATTGTAASRWTTAAALTAVSRAARPAGLNLKVTLTFVPSGTPAPMSSLLVT
jgi:hypothetical protein